MRTIHLLTLLGIGVSPACSDYEMKGESTGGAYYDTGYYAPEEGDDDGGRDTGTDDWEPEQENDFLKLEPASTDAYVFVVNQTRNTATRISVPSLAVVTTEVGSNPVAVATTGDYTTAVTFNAGTDDLSIIDAQTLQVTTVAVRDNFNTIKMSPDGQWVLCWHDSSAEDDVEDDGGTQSFNEISLVNIRTAEHFPMVVGFNPRDVQFTEDSGLAVVVSDAYLALIDLTVDEPSPERIQVAEDLIDPPVAEEVLVAPDGSFAIVRQFGATTLTLVDLQLGDVDSLVVGNNPTDLDLSSDGSKAIAVARGSGQLWLYDLADPWGTPQVVELPDDGVWGSVVMSPDGSKGLLYSTATGDNIYASWDTQSDEVTARSLVKPIDSISVSPDGSTALVFHSQDDGTIDPDSPYAGEWALSLIDLSDFFANPLLLPAEPTAFAQADDGKTGFFIMEGEPLLEVLHYDTLLYDEIDLSSNPVHVGVLPEVGTAYVSQEHDLGRISFYDPDTEDLQTITGFELNSGIEH